MNYTGPKVRISRRLGVALTPKAGKVMSKKSYPPGEQGGNRRRGRTSIYGRQLLEKQRLRSFYNIHERQMRNYFKKAVRLKGSTSDDLVGLLETRLDAVVHRGGLARTIYAARQYVAHGLILINGKMVDKPSAPVSVGDVITIKEKKRDLPCFQEALVIANPPAYLELDKEAKAIKLLSFPRAEEVPMVKDFELSLVVELYSR